MLLMIAYNFDVYQLLRYRVSVKNNIFDGCKI